MRWLYMKKKTKSVLKGKKIVYHIMCIFLLLMIFSLITSIEFGKEEVKTYEMKVQYQDTLWNIATTIANEKHIDIHKAIYDIKKVNGLKNSNIYVGQILKIPLYES